MPNPFAPLAWPPPPVGFPPADFPPPAAPPVAAPPVAAPPVAATPVETSPAAAAPVDALLVDRVPEAEVHVHDPAWTAHAAPTAPPPAVASRPTEASAVAQPDDTAPVGQAAPQSAVPARAATAADTHPEMLRLFEVVTNMCDHVIEYIETDRAERRVMLETLATLGRAINESAAALASRTVTAFEATEPRLVEHPEARERVIGGSMPAGPQPVIDLRNAPGATAPAPVTAAVGPARDESASPLAAAVPSVTPAAPPATVMTTEIAVEVRGRFGDRWVDGFEICEVMETPEGHRYRLRRHRDGVVLPELFDATSIRHVETFDQLATTNGTHLQNGNGNGLPEGRDASANDATGYAAQSITGAPTRWSRS